MSFSIQDLFSGGFDGLANLGSGLGGSSSTSLLSGAGGAGGAGGVGGNNWMGSIAGEAQEGIQNSLQIAAMSKELSMAQALGKFMKANGDACKSMAP
jgi:hypothetical protein